MANNLPGARHRFDPSWGTTCECGKPATISIQGETDSFGHELINLCQTCADKPQEPLKGTCDYCKGKNLLLHHHRDFEEGNHGPVYEICEACGKRAAAALPRESDQELEEGFYSSDPDDTDW